MDFVQIFDRRGTGRHPGDTRNEYHFVLNSFLGSPGCDKGSARGIQGRIGGLKGDARGAFKIVFEFISVVPASTPSATDETPGCNQVTLQK